MISIQNGNHPAFKIIVKKYLNQAVRVATRIVSNKSIAEEIVQETFLKVWERANLWEKRKSKFKTWFFRILKNACLDFLRKKSLDFTENNQNIIDASQYNEINLIEKQTAFIVQKEINNLKQNHKAALIFFYYEGFKIREIAEIIGKSEKAIESILIQSRKKLKKKLKNHKLL
ncbi:MAG: hypothetical protein B6I26_01190 [Desulfobacteraceae bacterium 4572_130]|nr:MAG: hypothetical protein B6I26_01190 [Desulfobacteraceae bacterium 4572_130]